MLLNVIKIVATFMTAVFGVLGTFKDYSKDKESKRWQALTIAGIIVSALIGSIAQNMEYRQGEEDKRHREQAVKETTDNLTRLGTSLGNASTTLEKNLGITTEANRQLKLELGNQQQFATGQGEVLKKQGQALVAQNESVTTLGRIANPTVPVGFGLELELKDAGSTRCIENFADVLRERLIKDAILTKLPTEAHISSHYESGGEPLDVEFSNKSFLTTLTTLPLNSLNVSVSFRKPQGTPILYEVGETEGIPADEREMAEGTALLAKGFDSVSVHFGELRPAKTPSSIRVFRAYVNIRPENTDTPFHSIHDFIGAEMQLSAEFRGPAGACSITSELTAVNLAWGQNYAFGHELDPKKFKRVADPAKPQLATFTYHPTASDLGFAK